MTAYARQLSLRRESRGPLNRKKIGHSTRATLVFWYLAIALS